ncbi:MAG: chromate transporter [Acetobacteraceae bacterium]|nr:chromate transporter [Acetobacteraceae bacterium]
MRASLLWAMFVIFAPLSFATIGGGAGVIAEYHRQVVVQHGWLAEQQFVYDFALSRLAPGPGSLLVTLLGWQIAGWSGALVASVAIFLPSSLLLYALAHVWARFRGRAWQRAVERGLAPLAAGLILAASLTVLEAAQGGWRAWAVASLSTVALTLTRMSPFLPLTLGALAFLFTT